MSSIAALLLAKWQGNEQGLRDEYKSKLKVGVWVVEFTKVDGTPCIMECTLDPKLLPPVDPLKAQLAEHRDEQVDLLAVYATDRQGWRSFKVANVKSFYPKPEPL